MFTLESQTAYAEIVLKLSPCNRWNSGKTFDSVPSLPRADNLPGRETNIRTGKSRLF